eukprot:00374.XXX_436_591_1 [CDS] Oithona nana genome sequencing.
MLTGFDFTCIPSTFSVADLSIVDFICCNLGLSSSFRNFVSVGNVSFPSVEL